MVRFTELLVAFVSVASSSPSVVDAMDAVDVSQLQDSICTNCDAINAALGFSDPAFDPWADALWSGYNTEIADVNCVVQIDEKASEKEGKLVYSLANIPADVDCPDITHTSSCGTCSDLQSLSLYIENNNLENDISQCGQFGYGFILVANGFPAPNPQNPAEIAQSSFALNAMARAGAPIIIPPAARQATMQCIMSLGFKSACARTWTSTTLLTATHCAGECFVSLFAGIPANLPGPPPANTYPPGFGGNYCQQDICPSTVNGVAGSWCYPEASELGSPFRLSECLQCDECLTGPVFLKYAGRARRNSGLVSNIARPPYLIPDIEDDFCVGKSCNTKTPKACRATNNKKAKSTKAPSIGGRGGRTKAPSRGGKRTRG